MYGIKVYWKNGKNPPIECKLIEIKEGADFLSSKIVCKDWDGFPIAEIHLFNVSGIEVFSESDD